MPGPFDILVGEVGGVPLSVRFQNEMDSSDPDNNAIALMRMDVCSDKGILSLMRRLRRCSLDATVSCRKGSSRQLESLNRRKRKY